MEEERKKGFTKIFSSISSVFKKKMDLQESEETHIQEIEERLEKINFEHFNLEEKDKNNIIEKIESLN